MAPMKDYQVVVLAGGNSSNLYPLVSKDVPKALLPVANRPVLAYALDLLEDSNLKDVIVVVAGDDAAAKITGWIEETYHERLQVHVSAVAEDAGTADALRAVAHRLTSENTLVVSGDLVCDLSLGAIASAHQRHNAALTALLCPRSTADGAEPAAGSAKEKAKKFAASDVIGLDAVREHLLFIASGSQLGKELKVPYCLLREAGQMEIRCDLIDAHLYAFNRALALEVLHKNDKMKSIKKDLVPYFVRSQLELDTGIENDQFDTSRSSFKCSACLAPTGRYCSRVNTIEAYGDINRDVAGDAIHLTGYTLSNNNNVINPTAQTGVKTAVGPQCIIGEGSQLGDKCSVKRSVVGRHCRIGSNVKIINSVVMNYVTVDDGCLIQNSVVCSNVHLQERSTLKDCQVGSGYVVGIGAEHRFEALAKKEKP